MRVSFDLDGVLFLTQFDDAAKLEPELKFPWNRIYKKDRLRKGTKELIHGLQSRGFEVWVYTSSARPRGYIARLFRRYGIRFSDIINNQRHESEIQKGRVDHYPTKLPSRYRISLHVDDEWSVVENGKTFGFNVFQLKDDNTNWVSDIIERAEEIRAREGRRWDSHNLS